jgi:outer membrane protein TolC
LIPEDDESLIQANSTLSAGQSNTKTNKSLYRNSFMSYLPSLTASYSYGWRENNTLALDDYSPKTFMLHFTVPVFTSFQNFTTLKSSYYGYKQVKEQFYDQLKEIRFFITESVNRLLNLKTQRDLSLANTEFTEHNYRVVAQQKEKGLISNIDFIDAKLNLQDAKLNEINTQYDFISSMVELYYFLGKIDTIIQ